MLRALFVATVTVFVSGCGTVNSVLVDKNESREIYHIFDIRGEIARDQIVDSVVDGMSRSVGDLNSNYPIPPKEIPQRPGRFEVSDPLKGTQLGALAAMGGGRNMMKAASCDGSIWSGNATRDLDTATTRLFGCIWQYSEGYHLDLYVVVTEKKQGVVKSLVSKGVEAALGTPEEWAHKIVRDTVNELKEDFPDINLGYVEGRPELDKRVGWLSEKLH